MDLHNFPFQMDLHNFPFQFNILVSVLMSKNSGKIEVGILYRSDSRLFEESIVNNSKSFCALTLNILVDQTKVKR